MSQSPPPHAADLEGAVRQRYASAARAPEPALCCPTSCDPRETKGGDQVTAETAPLCKPGSCC